ncbi:MAG: AAA family ATPase [Phycisphaeraceae bacterium]
MQKILGQDHALEVLRAALASGRMHHAWIFHGPVGVGKATTALAVAKVLLCHQPVMDETGVPSACGNCRSCSLLAREGGAHPDLHVVRKELAQFSDDASVRGRKQMNIPLAVINERLLNPAHQSASLQHNKVFVVDEAELLGSNQKEGQNALLKTLEEPPDGTFIFLVTSHEDRLLPTIRSRCQRVGFGNLSDEQVAKWVEQHPDAAELSDKQRQWVSQFARGSLGRAALVMRYRLDVWADELEPMVRQVLNGRPVPELGPTMAELVETFAKAWVDHHANASKDAANKAGVRHLFNLLAERCRRGLHETAERLAGETADATEAAMQPYLNGVELIRQAEGDLDANVALPLLLDNLAIQWASENEPQSAGP